MPASKSDLLLCNFGASWTDDFDADFFPEFPNPAVTFSSPTYDNPVSDVLYAGALQIYEHDALPITELVGDVHEFKTYISPEGLDFDKIPDAALATMFAKTYRISGAASGLSWDAEVNVGHRLVEGGYPGNPSGTTGSGPPASWSESLYSVSSASYSPLVAQYEKYNGEFSSFARFSAGGPLSTGISSIFYWDTGEFAFNFCDWIVDLRPDGGGQNLDGAQYGRSSQSGQATFQGEDLYSHYFVADTPITLEFEITEWLDW